MTSDFRIRRLSKTLLRKRKGVIDLVSLSSIFWAAANDPYAATMFLDIDAREDERLSQLARFIRSRNAG